MAADDQAPLLPSAEELLRLNRMLDEQVKTLVKIEQRLFVSQRELARRNLRLDALTKFAVQAAELTDAGAILSRASAAITSVFAFEQSVGFVAEGRNRYRAVAARDAATGDRGSVPDSACELAVPLPSEPLIETLGALAARGFSPLIDCCDRVFCDRAAPDSLGMLLPLTPRGDEPLGVLLVRRIDTAVTFHEELPTASDQGYLALFTRLVAANVNNTQLVLDLSRSYKQLARAQEEIVGRERLAALGEFAALVAHEVRNPLGVIFNVVAILERSAKDAEATNLLTMLGEESRRLDRIVSDLIDFARPNPPQFRPENLRRIVDSALDSVRASIPGAFVEVLVEREPQVLADARMMRQAILNLVVNAVQASPEGERVAVRVGVGGDGDAFVAVENRGAPIPDDVVARLFEPFFTTKPTGTGLGLSVVRRIADVHRGRIDVISSPERTVFSLRLATAE
jgi:signal transduction histidine kinase